MKIIKLKELMISQFSQEENLRLDKVPDQKILQHTGKAVLFNNDGWMPKSILRYHKNGLLVESWFVNNKPKPETLEGFLFTC